MQVRKALDQCEDNSSRLGPVESDVKHHTVEIEALKKLISELGKKVDGKLECEFFDEEMQKMRLLIASFGSGKGTGDAPNAIAA